VIRVAQILNSKEYLRKGRIHPINVLKALKTYRSGGSLGKSSKTWIPIPRIVDILELALECDRADWQGVYVRDRYRWFEVFLLCQFDQSHLL
jgi:hypothetical protein